MTLLSPTLVQNQRVASVGGLIRQVVNVQDGEVATGTTTIPADDTIPQNTEGDEYITLAITPLSPSSKLLIEAVVMLASSAGGVMQAALFQDTTADALAVGIQQISGANAQSAIVIRHYMTAGTNSSTTFKIRAGLNVGGTTTFNGAVATRRYGGTMASSITITEIAA